MREKYTYQSLYQDASDGRDEVPDKEYEAGLEQQPRASASPQSRALGQERFMFLLNMSIFVCSLLFFALSFNNFRSNTNWLLQRTSHYSPMYAQYDVEMEERIVAGTLFDEDTLSQEDLLLRSYPTSESDAAWRLRTDVGIVTISSEEVERLGKDPKKTVKAPLEFGRGPDAHLAEIDGQHALHCLYAVRRYAYREYYFPEANGDTFDQGQSPLTPFHQAHLAHCLHILLQTLSCTPSLDIITHNWVDTQLYPFPDFAIEKKCIKHDQLLQWQAQNRLSQDQWRRMASIGPQPNDTVLPMPPKFREWSIAEDKKNQAHHN